MDSSHCITLNVGGQSFTTRVDTLTSLPNTRLGRLAREMTLTSQQEAELFFDRNPDIINSLLDLYRTGELHLPTHLCGSTVIRELEFWEIPAELITECCFKRLDEHKSDGKITAEIDQFLSSPYETPAELQNLSRWNKLWLIMERPKLCRASKMWSTFFFMVVFLSVLLYLFETSMAFRKINPWFSALALQYNLTEEAFLSYLNLIDQLGVSSQHAWLRYAHEITFAFFIGEFFVRLLCCPSKRHFVRQAKNWLDSFLLVQNGLSIVIDEVVMKDKTTFTRTERNALIFFNSLSVLRVLRIFYIAKNFDTMKILLLSTRSSVAVLALLALCLLSLATLFGASTWLAELLTDEFTFSSIPYAMWYAIVTMTTVGYGDVYPVSSAGRLVGILCALCGVIVMALPIAVIASKFTTYHDNIASRQQMRRRLLFLKHNPDFCKHSDTSGDTGHNPTTGKHLESQKNSDKKKGFADEEEESQRSCFRFGPFKRRTRRISSHQIWVAQAPLKIQDQSELCEDVTADDQKSHI